MHSEMVRGICHIGIFIVCAQALVHIRPDASYEKYLKMLVSAMVLLQVFQALGGILQKGGEGLTEQVAQFQKQLDEHARMAGERREEAEKLREQMTLEEVQRRAEESRTEGEKEVTQIPPVDEIRVDISEGGGNNEAKVE